MKKHLIVMVLAAYSLLATAQNSGYQPPCGKVILTAEEQAFWVRTNYTPVWRDSCQNKQHCINGTLARCLMCKWLLTSPDPDAKNDLTNPIFNRFLDDARILWDAQPMPGGIMPYLIVPYKAVVPKFGICK
jgi:hypothetical protein